jgi:hypothetical protein
MVRVALAVAAAAAVILSAPFVQQAFTAASAIFPNIGTTATALPIAVAVLVAIVRVRDRRRLRFTALAVSLAIGAFYIRLNALSATESFHFVEYTLVACLFYMALLPADDGLILVLPAIAAIATGILDEWFQWFIPIRAGEMRDIALDAVASVCGVLFAVSLRPPPRLTLRIARASRARVGVWAGAALALFALFAVTVHVGYEIRDPEVGTFVSRYTPAQLEALARDRRLQWQARPPVAIRRVSREDQYLSEGLWHVQRRNEAWQSDDLAVAWRENLILEKFFAPVLDAQTYASATPQRWPSEQRAEAASRPGVDRRPLARSDYRWPLYVFPVIK